MIKLYPFQSKAVDFHLSNRFTINASEMGLGKSIMALEAAKQAGGATAVFGPAFLEANWQREAKRYGVEIDYYRYSSFKANASRLKSVSYRTIIADECHYLKNPMAGRTKSLFNYMAQDLPGYFIGLTGTPIRNRIPDLYSLLRFCSLTEADNGFKLLSKKSEAESYRVFCERYCNVTVKKANGRIFRRYSGVKAGMVKELKALMAGKFIRFTADKVLGDLPELTEVPVMFDLEPVVGLEDAFEAYREGAKTNIQAKALSAMLKAPNTAEYVQGILETGEPVVVFTDHIAPAKAIAEKLKVPAITGAMPVKSRAAMVEDFQQGSTKALVATIGSLGVGVTLHRSKHVVFNDISWVPSENQQAEKRIHRIGQSRACFAHYMDASETDAFIRDTVNSKLSTIEKVIQ